MNINDISLHDAQILEVRETEGQTIDFLIDFATDWQNDVFERRILRFKDVISYQIDEIPFAGRSTILNIVDVGQITKIFGSGRSKREVVKNRIEIITNAGNRRIEYSGCELIIPN